MKGLPDAVEFAERVSASLSGPDCTIIPRKKQSPEVRRDIEFGRRIGRAKVGVKSLINPPIYSTECGRDDVEDLSNIGRYDDYLERLAKMKTRPMDTFYRVARGLEARIKIRAHVPTVDIFHRVPQIQDQDRKVVHLGRYVVR